MSRIKSVNHGFNEVNDECARIFVNLVIYMHAKNSDEMPLLINVFYFKITSDEDRKLEIFTRSFQLYSCVL